MPVFSSGDSGAGLRKSRVCLIHQRPNSIPVGEVPDDATSRVSVFEFLECSNACAENLVNVIRENAGLFGSGSLNGLPCCWSRSLVGTQHQTE